MSGSWMSQVQLSYTLPKYCFGYEARQNSDHAQKLGSEAEFDNFMPVFYVGDGAATAVAEICGKDESRAGR